MFDFASMLHGNSLFETAALALGMGRPACRGLLADALRHASVSPKSVSREELLRLLPQIQRRLGLLTGAAIAEERVLGLCSYLDRTPETPALLAS
jgi:hypothetical protein